MLANSEFRMFPAYEGKPELIEKDINSIAAAMVGTALPRGEVRVNNLAFNQPEAVMLSELKAGHTYFGQFIAHDIVPGTSTLRSTTSRKVTPILNLDSLYGDRSFYHFIFEPDGKFKLGKRKFDVIRDELGNALTPEPRNDENVIIVQFHLLWQRIHNKFCDVISECCPVEIQDNNGLSINKAAKNLTISLFHLVTIEDYLKTVLDKDVFEEYFNNSLEHIIPAHGNWEMLPLEFTHAAFRFGHSMVLNNYKLNAKPSVNLSKLLRGTRGGYLTKNQKIQWTRFFGLNAQDAQDIDLGISRAMGSIPPMKRHIVKLNLNSAINQRLPSGFQINKYLQLNHPILSANTGLSDQEELKYTIAKPKKILKKLYSHQTLPLWLYILDETKINNQQGKSLGKVGSILVAEVLRKAILEHYRQQQPSLLYSGLIAEIYTLLTPSLSGFSIQYPLTFENIINTFLEN